MEKYVEKWIIEAANYFRGEVLEINPDIPRDVLSAMVEEYIYYHRAGAGREETHQAVLKACA